MNVEFCKMLFLHLLRRSCSFVFSVSDVVNYIHWLICACWAIPVILGWIQLGHGIWSFLCVVRFRLLAFYLDFCIYIHQRYWPIIFFFYSIFIWFWYQGNSGFIECPWECSLLYSLLEDFERDQYEFFLYVW